MKYSDLTVIPPSTTNRVHSWNFGMEDRLGTLILSFLASVLIQLLKYAYVLRGAVSAPIAGALIFALLSCATASVRQPCTASVGLNYCITYQRRGFPSSFHQWYSS